MSRMMASQISVSGCSDPVDMSPHVAKRTDVILRWQMILDYGIGPVSSQRPF